MQRVKTNAQRSLSLLLVLALILSLCAMPIGTAYADDAPDLTIGSIEELQAFADAVDNGETYEGKTVVLTADIDASNVTWNPIGEKADNKSFKGTFDGQGHTVTLSINSASGYNGLFCYNFGTIKNVKIAGSIETTAKNAMYNGAVCAQNKSGGVVDSCINEAVCTYAGGYSAGVVGQNAGTVSNCVNRGSISVGGTMGGAITCGGTVTNCLNIGTLSGKAYNISYSGTVSNSYYLDTSSSPSLTRFYGVAKTETELKAPEFAATLGDSFAADANGGFPVLKWEAGNDAPHSHEYGDWISDGDATHSRSCECGDKQTEEHSWDAGTVTVEPTTSVVGVKTFTCTVCGETKAEEMPTVTQTCSVAIALEGTGNINTKFTIPLGQTLDITWKFIYKGDVPYGWAMVINGVEPTIKFAQSVYESDTYTYDEAAIAPIKIEYLASMMALYNTGVPEAYSFTPTQEQCDAGETVKATIETNEIPREDLEFELVFVNKDTNEVIGSYYGEDGTGYHAKSLYGEQTIASKDVKLYNWFGQHYPGYRLYRGTIGNYDQQNITIVVDKDGVVQKRVEMLAEVNHGSKTYHAQNVKFMDGDTVVLETLVPLKNGYVDDYTAIELDLSEASAKLAQLGYEFDDSVTYTVKCNNYTHDPEVTVIEVSKTSQPVPYEYTVEDGRVTITKYLGSESEVIVPGKIEGKPVVAIGANAFAKNEAIVKMTLPASVASIGQSAFAMCTKLESINAENVESFGAYAFFQCSSLKAIAFKDSIETLPVYLFSECTSLANVKLPANLKALSNHLFDACERLKSVDIPDGVTLIDRSAFENAGIETIVIPDTVTKIGDYAFENAPLTTVTFGKNVEELGSLVFWGCDKLTEIVIPDKVSAIPYGTFFNCTNLTKVVIGKNITTIDETAFKGANNAVIYGYSNSAAFSFAKANNIKFSCIEHIYIDTVTAPTCTAQGYTTHTCACGDSYVDSYTAALGHSYGAWKQTKAPTCTEAGAEVRSCSLCGAAETREIAALGHDYKHYAAKSATCTEAGWEAYDTCSRCDYTTYKEIAATGHHHDAVVTAPTCTEKGYTTHTCACGDSYVDSYIAALGHDYKAGKCTRCGAADASYVAVPALKITTASGHPKLSWNAVDGAYKYWIYRSTDGKTFKYYDRTTKTDYTNISTTLGTTYYYKVKAVKAVDGKDVASDYSVVKSIQCRPAAVNISIYRVNGKPQLKWSAVDGATKYWIYRSTDGVNFKYYDSTTKTSYTNTGAASGTKYYYKVKAVAVVNGTNVASAYSNSKSLLTTLAAPSVSITTANGKPKVTWKAVTGADKYYVYRSTDGKNFSYWDSTTNLSYTNLSANKGTKYFYKVKAVSAENSYANSAQSSTVSITATK